MNWQRALPAGTIIGDSLSSVKIVEFADLQCPACRDYQRTIDNVTKRFGSRVSVVFVHFPLDYHTSARPLARGAECAKAVGRFPEFVEAAYRLQSQVPAESLWAIATTAGLLDSTSFGRCIADTTAIDAAIDRGVAAGLLVGVTGTPTIIVNGWQYQFAPSESELVKFVKELLAGQHRRPAKSAAQGVIDPVRTVRAGTVELRFDSAVIASATHVKVASDPLSVVDGGDDPDFDLSNTINAVRLPKGSVAAFELSAKILVFDPTGAPSKIIGRLGQGPGEFVSGSLARLTGDTMVVFDPGNERLSWLLPDRGIIRTERTLNRLPSTGGFVVGGLPGGALVVSQADIWSSPAVTGHPIKLSAPVMVLPVSQSADTIATVPDVLVAPTRTGSGGDHLTINTNVRLAPSAHVVVWDTLIAVGTATSYDINILNRSGKVVERIVADIHRKPVTRAMHAKAVELELSMYPGRTPESTADPEVVRKMMRDAPYSDSLPAYSDLLVSPNQTLWVVGPRIPGDSNWSALGFRRDGALIGTVTGAGGVPIAFGDSTVMLKLVNSDGLIRFEVRALLGLPNHAQQ